MTEDKGSAAGLPPGAGGGRGPPERRVSGRRLLLIRHCATPLNEARRYQGHGDAGLSRAGRAMATEMAAMLRKRIAAPEHVWVSDLRRARETAALAFPGRTQRPDARLRELDFGAFSGATFDENLERHPRAFRRWLEDPDAHPPPGGERLSDLHARVVSWAEELPVTEDAVAVLHVGSLKAVVSWALGEPFARVIPRHLPIGAVVELRQAEGGWVAVEGWDAPVDPGPVSSVAPRPRDGRGAAWPGAGPAALEEEDPGERPDSAPDGDDTEAGAFHPGRDSG